MSNENRNDSIIVEAMATNANIAAFNVRSAAIAPAVDTFVPAFISAVLGGVTGLTLGQLLIKDGELASLAIGAALSWVSFNGFYFTDRWFSSPRYKADFWDGGAVDKKPGPAMLRTGAEHVQLKRIDGRMQSLLKTFARFYPIVGTTGINAWERSKHLSRTQITAVREYLVGVGAADVLDGGIVELSEWGEQQLPRWAAGDFAPTSPTAAGM